MQDVLHKKEMYGIYSEADICTHGGVRTSADGRPAFDEDLDEETLLDPDEYRHVFESEHNFDRADEAWSRWPHEDPRDG